MRDKWVKRERGVKKASASVSGADEPNQRDDILGKEVEDGKVLMRKRGG